MEEIRIIKVQQKKTLANGDVKIYTVNRKYTVKGGYMHNGVRKPRQEFTEEQKAEINRRHGDGVSIVRLCKDYDCAANTIKKVLGLM